MSICATMQFTFICIQKWLTCTHMCVHMYVMYVHIYICVHIDIFIFVDIVTYSYIHGYTCVSVSSQMLTEEHSFSILALPAAGNSWGQWGPWVSHHPLRLWDHYEQNERCSSILSSAYTLYGRFRKLSVPYFGVLIRIFLS